jgi:uncharacterized protein (DUF1800 family)
MRNAVERGATGSPWSAYEPDTVAPWDRARVVHLHRRAGFSATEGEVRRDLAEGPGASVERLLKGRARSEGVPDGFESIAARLADAAVGSNDPNMLKAWWVYRMLFGPDPLGERLALMWHDHFATSNLKVDDLGAMRRQNEVFRELGRAPFGRLLDAMLEDPALLVWLDAPSNGRDRPNENLARELFELFTLGVGQYGEGDIKQAARALTGRTIVAPAEESTGRMATMRMTTDRPHADRRYQDDRSRHDDGEKTILGRTGRWSGSDLVRMLLEHPATAGRLARRICGLLMGEGAVTRRDIDDLAEGLRSHHLDMGWAVGTVLRSRAFFAAANLRTRVLDPAPFVVGAARALELFEEPPSTLVLADWMARMGQDLFYPPNVGGWPGGRAWLTTSSLIVRANYAAAVVDGRGIGRARPLDVLGLVGRHGRAANRDTVITFLAELLFGAEPGGGWHGRIATALGRAAWESSSARRIATLVLACPEAQLG